jgi:hypothetical protein
VSSEDKKCPDCRGSLKEIKVIDKAGSVANLHSELEYTVPEAHRSYWTGHFPVEGKIAAYMCDGCGRVLLYGHPRLAEAP